jgi:hypothetical protein
MTRVPFSTPNVTNNAPFRLKAPGHTDVLSKLCKCESEQAVAKQDKAYDGHGEKTYGSEFVTHRMSTSGHPCRQLRTFGPLTGNF